MIDKRTILETITEKRLPVGHYLDLRTYKRNSTVVNVKTGDDNLLATENGYFSKPFKVDSDKLNKLLKTLLRKEFPRSNKVRLCEMGRFKEEESLCTQRKII